MDFEGERLSASSNESGRFQSIDGIVLYEHWWRPEREAKAGIVLVHGLAEHSGRYIDFADFLRDHGYAVDTFDLRGHGKSSGPAVYVNSFDDYMSDLDFFLDRVRVRLPGKPLFLFGFSMGAAITALFIIERKPQVRGVVLSAPVVRVSDSISPLLQKLSGAIASTFPRMRMVRLNHRHLSRDESVCTAYDRDPLVYRRGIPARTGFELIKAARRIQAGAADFAVPVLILQGSEDKLVDPEASRFFFESIGSGDRTLKLYEGLFHEVMNEPERESVRDDVLTWLDAHIRSGDR
jgi:alpha-beta hydrolase superfamily lysophospholipase